MRPRRPRIHRVYELLLRPFRERRMRRLVSFLGERAGLVLDVGGTAFNWQLPGAAGLGAARVVLLNPERAEPPADPRLLRVRARGEALPFRDGAFDAVFCNSVIEHLAPGPARSRFACELTRVGRRLFLQTPAKSFPVEPHLLALGVHYLPRRWQRRLIRWTTLWGWIARPDHRAVERCLAGTQLLGAAELARLFPGAALGRERFLGLTKSYLVLRGSEAAPQAPPRGGEPLPATRPRPS